MTNLQTLTRELRERISSQRTTLMLIAAPELAGALTSADLLLLELEKLDDRIIALEASTAELVRLIRTADVLAHARDLDRNGLTP